MTVTRPAPHLRVGRTARHRLRAARWATTARSRTAGASVHGRVLGGGGRERGDVPGWVLVTLMTAGLVLALWALAGPALTTVFSDSISRVSGAIGG